MMKSTPMKLLSLSLLILASVSEAKDDLRSVRIELPDQESNPIKTSWPGVGTWFWTADTFDPDGYKPFIDLYAKHTNIRLLMTSIRHNVWVSEPAVHDQIKAAASYAQSKDMAIVMDLDARLSRQTFMEKYPGELQELVRMCEIEFEEAGTVSLNIKGIDLGDHYTFRAPKYHSLSGRLLRVYSYTASGDDVQDMTERCSVEQADGGAVQVSIPCTAQETGRSACMMAAFTLFTPDVFAPHLPEFEKQVIKQYADVPLAGACKDEWGFPGRFNPSTSDLWYSESMAAAYAARRPGHTLVRDMLLMFKGASGRQGEREAAVNHYMEMYWQQNAKIEQHYYSAIKEVFGKEAVVATHPTWFPFPGENEIFKNGLDWWAVPRDLAQTDETTPYCVRTALAKKCHSPLWYNMYYHEKIDSYETEVWQSLLGGGRLDYHQLFPFPDWGDRSLEWTRGLLKGPLMSAESRIHLLNYISTKPIDCPVAVIFGHAAAVNWTGSGFADVGLRITDALWEAGFYADLIPSSEIVGGALTISKDGCIQYGSQRYAAAVLYNPEYEQKATADFFVKAADSGKTKLFRVGAWSKDFEGVPFDGAAALPAIMKSMDANSTVLGVMEYLETEGYAPYTPCRPNHAHYGSSMVPDVSGHMRLLDGTVIYASGKNDVMGDPIQKTFSVRGYDVTFDSVGLAAVRLDEHGRLEAMAAGGLQSFQGGGIDISMPIRADVALWKDKNGAWQGVLQGYEGVVPEALTTLCQNWTRLKVPIPAQECSRTRIEDGDVTEREDYGLNGSRI
ncbi:MAG: hypothetical protein K9N55_03415 [Phycisphaerae bacterium]|nr:hypothetical protein [Phycisphaerae bacterium]